MYDLSLGMYFVELQITEKEDPKDRSKTVPVIVDGFYLEAESRDIAEANARAKAVEKWKALGIGVNQREIRVIKSETKYKSEEEEESKLRNVGENILEWTSATTELTGFLADLKEAENLAKKLDKSGKILSGIDIANDVFKIGDLVGKLFSSKTHPDKTGKIVLNIAQLFAKITKTVVTMVVPYTGLIDLGFSVIFGIYDSVSQAEIDQKKAAFSRR